MFSLAVSNQLPNCWSCLNPIKIATTWISQVFCSWILPIEAIFKWYRYLNAIHYLNYLPLSCHPLICWASSFLFLSNGQNLKKMIILLCLFSPLLELMMFLEKENSAIHSGLPETGYPIHHDNPYYTIAMNWGVNIEFLTKPIGVLLENGNVGKILAIFSFVTTATLRM